MNPNPVFQKFDNIKSVEFYVYQIADNQIKLPHVMLQPNSSHFTNTLSADEEFMTNQGS